MTSRNSNRILFSILQTIKKFRDDESEHHDTGLANNAEQVNHILSFI
jgi:demethoxyubiquinone hydroxylase (CLK1/Coq7/Cat5 family)